MWSKIKDNSITHKIFKMQSDDSIVCGFYCVTFMEYIVAEKFLLDYTNLFYLNDYKKNVKISSLKTNITSLQFRIKKIDQKRNIF